MSTTPNLGLPLLDPAQNNKAATVNEQACGFDVAIAGTLALSVAGGANVALTTTPDGGQAQNAILIFTGLLTANIVVTLPQITREWHIVNRTTGAFTLTLGCGSGATVAAPQGTEFDVRW